MLMGEIAAQLLARLHPKSPYASFPFENYALDLQGGPDHPLFRSLIANVRPNIVFEVGTWKGASAVRLASLLKEQGADAAIVCIDTWLGSVDQIMGVHAGWDIRPYAQHGYPTLYHQFLANVMHSGCQDLIVPFPNTSITAARWFMKQGFRADLIYLDGSHEEEDVYQDLQFYWKVLRPGGVIFGDDWNAYWYGVICAVSQFAREHEQKLQIADDKWIMQKEPNR
jgi:hypothetical protein